MGIKSEWRHLPLSKMIAYVQKNIVNPYIRIRDIECYGKCISCNGGITEAGHRFPVGTHKGMCLNIQNIHGQETSCNHFKSGNLDEYDKGLIARHGEVYLEELKQFERLYQASRSGKSYDRYDVVLIAETYLYLTENKYWVFRHKKFNNVKEWLLKKNIIGQNDMTIKRK